MARRQRDTSLPPPFLKRAWLPEKRPGDGLDWSQYPLSLPIIAASGIDITFEQPVTILVGENGSGKSTILEAIAHMAGFGEGGGAQGMRAVEEASISGADGGALGNLLRGAWLPQVKRGWFFRAETFFTVARYLDRAAWESNQVGPKYLQASHGEGFLDFFGERMDRQGLFILDEPESALSPQRQFEFLKLLRRMQRANNCQLIMATHSPILMALPDADLWHIDSWGIRSTRLEDTALYRLYREFALHPRETVEAMTE